MSLINYVTRIHFADHVLEDALDAELEAARVRRPLVLIDSDGNRNEAMGRLGLAFPRNVQARYFSLTERHASEADCQEAIRIYAENGCDGLVGFGGGPAMDLAKAVGIGVSHDGPLRRYVGVEGGSARIRNVIPPLLAIPATAGTGAEIAGVAVLSMRDGPNIALVSTHLVPRVVICDPTLTLDLDADRTASSGMDALTHCVETFIASAYNPPADGIALDGLRRAIANLERAVADGADLDARREMMAAALNGALAQQKGLGGVHAMSHALGGLGGSNIDHGSINAVLLPLVLEFNAPAAGDRYADIRRELDLPASANLGEAVIRLRERIGLPSSLSMLGVSEPEIVEAACFAASDYANRTNPRKASAEDYLAIMRAAF